MKNWQIVRELGKGSYGRVFLASPENEPPVAVKVAEYNQHKNDEVKSLKVEEIFLREFKGHPNIVQCFGSEDVSFGNNSTISHGLLLEYATEGSLHGLIKKAYYGDDDQHGLSEINVACYTRMLLRGLVEIHSKGIVHCDLKPANILVFTAPGENETGKVLKIGDFGLAKRVDDADYDHDHENSDSDSDSDSDDCYYHRGTPAYSSPESVECGLHQPCMDTWSLGCVVYEMLTGRRVWPKTADMNDLYDQILNGDAEMDKIELYHSKKAVDFLEKCLEKVPQNRWSPVQLLKHPFITQNLEEGRIAVSCSEEEPVRYIGHGKWVSTYRSFHELS